ncbi:MAG: NADH-quinone oxidoreductase subunit N, partial [Rhodospirillaceae bacterium]|nr:NADH-quinone oxidoreductase subunit N [Rhodospirillaceae bacterium]
MIVASIVASLPEIIVISGACLLLLVSLIPARGRMVLFAGISLAVVAAAAVATYVLAGPVRPAYGGMFVVDGFAVFFKAVVLMVTALVILISPKYLEEEGIERGEYFVLLLFALAGMMIMASAINLVSIYLGLELMALSVYVLAGFMRHDSRSNEAALKYVILGAVSSAIFLYGVSLVYGLTGTTQLGELAAALNRDGHLDPMLVLTTVFLVTGLVFKVGAVPLHMWVPDVYEGAP